MKFLHVTRSPLLRVLSPPIAGSPRVLAQYYSLICIDIGWIRRKGIPNEKSVTGDASQSSSSSAVSLGANMGRVRLFLLLLGVFTSPTEAVIATCLPGWDWVGDTSGFPIGTPGDGRADMYPLPSLSTRTTRVPVKSRVC